MPPQGPFSAVTLHESADSAPTSWANGVLACVVTSTTRGEGLPTGATGGTFSSLPVEYPEPLKSGRPWAGEGSGGAERVDDMKVAKVR